MRRSFLHRHIDRNFVGIAAVDIVHAVDFIAVDGRKGRGTGNDIVGQASGGNILFEQVMRFKSRKGNDRDAVVHRGAANLIFINIGVEQLFEPGSAGAVVEDDLARVFDGLTAFRHVKDHVRFDFPP